MNASGFRAALFLLGIVLSAIPTRAVAYTAVLLHPAGFDTSFAYGVSGASQVGDASNPTTAGPSHALLWSGTAASKVDLNPAGYTESYARGVSGANQVGYAYFTPGGGGPVHALMWSGTAASAVDLNPPGYSQSSAYGVSGAFQVGDGTLLAGNETALLWNGTAASKVALNNIMVSLGSHGRGISGTTQVGYGAPAPFGVVTHALMWSGTPDSEVDLNPPGFDNTYAYAVSGTSQVGEGAGIGPTGGEPHALLWHGLPTATDLHPAGFLESYAKGVSGSTQVGYGAGTFAGSFHHHALLWNGTAASVVDLQSSLTGLGHTFTDSEAYGISDSGDIVGYAFDAAGFSYAVLWKPVFGDYNGDGKIDAADYALWRKNPGANGGPGGFDTWRAHFGQAAGSGAGANVSSNAALPEPSTCALVACGLALTSVMRTRRRR